MCGILGYIRLYRATYSEGQGELVIMEKKMEPLYYAGFRV